MSVTYETAGFPVWTNTPWRLATREDRTYSLSHEEGRTASLKVKNSKAHSQFFRSFHTCNEVMEAELEETPLLGKRDVSHPKTSQAAFPRVQGHGSLGELHSHLPASV